MSTVDQHMVLDSLEKAIASNSIELDGKSIQDRLHFLGQYSSLINFYDENNKMQGSWQPILMKDPLILLASISKTDVLSIQRLFNQTLNSLDYLITSKANPNKVGTLVNQLFNQLTGIFIEIERWTYYMNKFNHQYSLRHYIFNEVSAKYALYLRSILAFKERINNYALLPQVDAVDTSTFKEFDTSLWKKSDQVEPFWKVLNLNISTDRYPLKVELSNLVPADIVSSLKTVGNSIIDFLNTIVNEANIEFRNFEIDSSQFPDTVLLRAFAELLSIQQKELNGITAKHLKFYYQSILQQEVKKASADKAFIALELAPKVSSYNLAENTLFKAGVDEKKQALFFNTTKSNWLYASNIQSAYTLSINKTNGNEQLILDHTVTPSKIVKDKSGKIRQWSTFGATSTATSQKLGLAIASPMLYLKEGSRTIRLLFEVKNSSTVLDKFNLASFYLSTATKWLKVSTTISHLTENDTNEYQMIAVDISLDQKVAPIVAFTKNPDGYTSKWPMVKMEFDQFIDITDPPIIQALTIEVAVRGVKSFELYNDYGKLNPKKPFQLFGPTPLLNSNFIIGSNELFSKPLHLLNIQLEWTSLPHGLDFANYYESYNNYPIKESDSDEGDSTDDDDITDDDDTTDDATDVTDSSDEDLTDDSDTTDTSEEDDSDSEDASETTKDTTASDDSTTDDTSAESDESDSSTDSTDTESTDDTTSSDTTDDSTADDTDTDDSTETTDADSTDDKASSDTTDTSTDDSATSDSTVISDSTASTVTPADTSDSSTDATSSTDTDSSTTDTTSDATAGTDSSQTTPATAIAAVVVDKAPVVIPVSPEDSEFNNLVFKTKIAYLENNQWQDVTTFEKSSDETTPFVFPPYVTDSGCSQYADDTNIGAGMLLYSTQSDSSVEDSTQTSEVVSDSTTDDSSDVTDSSTNIDSTDDTADVSANDTTDTTTDTEDSTETSDTDDTTAADTTNDTTMADSDTSTDDIASDDVDTTDDTTEDLTADSTVISDSTNSVTPADTDDTDTDQETTVSDETSTVINEDSKECQLTSISSFTAQVDDQEGDPLVTPEAELQLETLSYTETTTDGFLRMELSSPTYGFGSEMYAKVIADVALTNANNIAQASSPSDVTLIPPPNIPYAPVAKSITAIYHASNRYDFTVLSTYPIECFSYTPFEIAEIYNEELTLEEITVLCNFHLTSTSSTTSLNGLPLHIPFKGKGALLLQIDELEGNESLNLYFQLAPHLASITDIQTITYSTLSDTSWQKTTLLSDSTNTFRCSGILSLDLPSYPSSANPFMPANSYWLAITVNNNPDQFANTQFLSTNGVEVERNGTAYLEDENIPQIKANSITAPQPTIPQIAKVLQPFGSYGGRKAESYAAFNSRVSERIASKNRLVTNADFFQIIQQHFPEIYHSTTVYNADNGITNLHLVKRVANATNSEAFRPFVSQCELLEVQEFLIPKIAAFTNLTVGNFTPKYVAIQADIELNAGIAAGFLEQIAFKLNVFLSPWIKANQEQVKIQQSIQELDVSKFLHSIEEIKKVDNIGFFLFDQPYGSTNVKLTDDSLLKSISVDQSTLFLPYGYHFLTLNEPS